jgi:hypothetical protein
MHKPGIDFFSTGAGWLGGLRKLLAADAMMSLLVPASDDFDFLPPLILDFPFRGTNRSLNVSGALAIETIFSFPFFFTYY